MGENGRPIAPRLATFEIFSGYLVPGKLTFLNAILYLDLRYILILQTQLLKKEKSLV